MRPRRGCVGYVSEGPAFASTGFGAACRALMTLRRPGFLLPEALLRRLLGYTQHRGDLRPRAAILASSINGFNQFGLCCDLLAKRFGYRLQGFDNLPCFVIPAAVREPIGNGLGGCQFVLKGSCQCSPSLQREPTHTSAHRVDDGDHFAIIQYADLEQISGVVWSKVERHCLILGIGSSRNCVAQDVPDDLVGDAVLVWTGPDRRLPHLHVVSIY